VAAVIPNSESWKSQRLDFHEIKFYSYGTSHSTCGEHLLRDLKGLRDLLKIPWAGKMRMHVAGMNDHFRKTILASHSNQCDNLPRLLYAGFFLKKLLRYGRHPLVSQAGWH